MLLLKYDFYDIYAVLTAIRSHPNAPYNLEMINCVKKILLLRQESNCVNSNIVRTALRRVKNIDKKLFHWIDTNNVYTYIGGLEKDEFYYRFLGNAFAEMFLCAETREYDRLRDLADALHNVPIFIADGCRNFKKVIRTQFSFYNRKYKVDLWKEFLK